MLANRGAARLACRTLSGFRGAAPASIVCDAPVLRRRRADEQPAEKAAPKKADEQLAEKAAPKKASAVAARTTGGSPCAS